MKQGSHHSVEACEKNRLAHVGVPCSKEHRKNIGLGNKGKIHSEDWNKNISKSHTGIFKGPLSYEHRKKLSLARKGIPQGPHSEERRKNIGLGNKGKNRSEEFKKAISLVHKGVSDGPHSEEAKKKMSLAKARAIAAGVFHPESSSKRYKTGYFHSDKNQQSIYYGSSYELAAFVVLEQLSTVAQYKRCHTSVPYVNVSGENRLYTPDILVEYTDGTKEVLEIKPKHLVNDETNARKCIFAESFFVKQGVRFSVWTEKELQLVS